MVEWCFFLDVALGAHQRAYGRPAAANILDKGVGTILFWIRPQISRPQES